MKRRAEVSSSESINGVEKTCRYSIECDDDLLARTKSCQVSLDDLLEKHFDKYSSFASKDCQCDIHSPFIRAGPFILGAQLKDAQFVDLDQFVARKIGDSILNRYYLLKIVTLPFNKENESYSQRQAKLLLYNEFSVLSLLKDQEGVVHHQGLYLDYFLEDELLSSNSDNSASKISPSITIQPSKETFLDLVENDDATAEPLEDSNKKSTSTQHPSDNTTNGDAIKKGPLMRRLILALECYIPHIYCSTVYPLPKLFSKFTTVNSEHENLQECVKRFKSIPEMKALLIFKQIVNIIYELHQLNIAHRDLRLENILYSHRSEKIILVNFGLARYVINDKTCICDHRGSSAYISPDVLKRKPYNPKASDCWALGIIFYTMLFGKFPFYAESFTELFKKINSGQFTIPINVLVWKNSHDHQPSKTENHPIVVHSETIDIINSLIVTDANKRINIVVLKERLHSLIEDKFKAKADLDTSRLIKNGCCVNEDLQVVPDVDLPEYRNSHKNASEVMSSNQAVSRMDNKKMRRNSTFSFSSETGEPTTNHSSETNQINSFPSSVLLSSINDSMELQSPRGRFNSREHLHDHNYAQKDDLLKAHPSGQSFKAYLESVEFRNSTRFVTSTFSRHQDRFYYMCGSSVYENEFKNYNSLLLDTIHFPSQPPPSPKRYRTKSCPPNDFFNHSLSHYSARQPSKGFVRLGSKMADMKKSNFSIIKVDSDIRHLNSVEMDVFNKLNNCKTNS